VLDVADSDIVDVAPGTIELPPATEVGDGVETSRVGVRRGRTADEMRPPTKTAAVATAMDSLAPPVTG